MILYHDLNKRLSDADALYLNPDFGSNYKKLWISERLLKDFKEKYMTDPYFMINLAAPQFEINSYQRKF